MTQQRISNLSCDINEFNKAATEYQKVLTNSGFNEKLLYEKTSKKHKQQRKRNILWYNPPFDAQVKTNVAKCFLQLIDIHFPPHHKLHKILNRNSVKVSYSSMPNIASHISSHNIKILEKYRNPSGQLAKGCSCLDKSDFPLPGNCQENAIIYNAEYHVG